MRHTSHMLSDAAAAVTVAVAETDGLELMTGSWLLVSLSASLSFSEVIRKASVVPIEPKLWLITFRN